MTDINKIHIKPANRGFGLGFGAEHQVSVYTEEGPKTGALVSASDAAYIEAWGKSQTDRRAIILSQFQLSNFRSRIN
jgi:hypothetical protein